MLSQKEFKKHQQFNTEENWKEPFRKLKALTQDTKLIWFQFRILHNILTTNRSVSKYDNNQTDRCTFCRTESETVIHLLWTCPKVKVFWTQLKNIINTRCHLTYTLTFDQTSITHGILTGEQKNPTLELIIIIAKHYIYYSKVCDTQPHVNKFIQIIHNRYKIEGALTNNKQNKEKFSQKWEKYLNIFKDLSVE